MSSEDRRTAMQGMDLWHVTDEEIESRGVPDSEVGYTTRMLLQTLFPYRKPDVDKVVRQSGPIKVTAMSTTGLPYGKYPRLICIYLITEAVRRQHLPEDEARRIPLGKSLQQFMNAIGVSGSRATGGKSGTLGIVREQLRRLAGTTITLEKIYETADDRLSMRNLGLFDSMDYWVTPHPDQLALSTPYLELTRHFYREVIDGPIPVNLAVLRELGQPRAMDLYIWATYKRYALPRTFEMSWDQAQSQFGPDTAQTVRARVDFRKQMRKAVETVNELWEDSGLSITDQGIELAPGRPSIAPREQRSVPSKRRRSQ